MRLSFGCFLLLTMLCSACGKQAEGEKCDKRALNDGNSDCQDGLVCEARANLNGSSHDRCCPTNRSTATTDFCKLASNQFGGDAAIPPTEDSGTPDAAPIPDAAVVDAGADVAADSGADASL